MLAFSSDTILLKQIQNGYFDVVDTLILKYEPLIKTIIRDEVNNSDAADDVYGEICLAIVRRFRRKGTADIHAVDKWIKQVVRSKCKEYWRNEQNHQMLTAPAQERYTAAMQQKSERTLRQNEIFEVIDEMSLIYKDVVELWLQGWTSAEIGEKLGIPESTVKSRKRKIIRNVRAYFDVPLSHK